MSPPAFALYLPTVRKYAVPFTIGRRLFLSGPNPWISHIRSCRHFESASTRPDTVLRSGSGPANTLCSSQSFHNDVHSAEARIDLKRIPSDEVHNSFDGDSDDVPPDDQSDLFSVEEGDVGLRLDRLLADRYDGHSRSYFQSLIDQGHVQLNGKTVPAKARRTELGDLVSVHFQSLVRDLPLTPENIPLQILYEDDHIVMINKPAGLVVHPAPGNWTGTVIHGLAFRYDGFLNLGGPRPGVVHRLDKGTSGVMVFARTAEAHRALTAMFAQREIEKIYIAITVGNPASSGCTSTLVDAPIGRSRVDRLRMMVLAEEAGGKYARSLVEVMAHDDRALLHAVRIQLETGRTHQIRVHMRHVRAPVLGDDLYGAVDINRKFRTSACRPMLHAHCLRFQHPMNGEQIEVKAPLPEDMRTLLSRNVYPQFHHEQPDW